MQHLPDPARSMTETVPVQFQYSAHNEYSTVGTDENFFQDHHTLHTNYNSYDRKQVNPVHLHKNTSQSGPPAHCGTCPQVYNSGLQTR